VRFGSGLGAFVALPMLDEVKDLKTGIAQSAN
jgi:hypothetical protein